MAGALTGARGFSSSGREGRFDSLDGPAVRAHRAGSRRGLPRPRNSFRWNSSFPSLGSARRAGDVLRDVEEGRAAARLHRQRRARAAPLGGRRGERGPRAPRRPALPARDGRTSSRASDSRSRSSRRSSPSPTRSAPSRSASTASSSSGGAARPPSAAGAGRMGLGRPDVPRPGVPQGRACRRTRGSDGERRALDVRRPRSSAKRTLRTADNPGPCPPRRLSPTSPPVSVIRSHFPALEREESGVARRLLRRPRRHAGAARRRGRRDGLPAPPQREHALGVPDERRDGRDDRAPRAARSRTSSAATRRRSPSART